MGDFDYENQESYKSVLQFAEWLKGILDGPLVRTRGKLLDQLQNVCFHIAVSIAQGTHKRTVEHTVEAATYLDLLVAAKALTRAQVEDGKILLKRLAEMFPESQAKPKLGIPPGGIDLEGQVTELEKSLVSQALVQASGSQTKAARLLGISLRSMRYKLQKYGLE